jgi:TIR domain/Mechanosensitive ion channel, beta-domain
MFNAVSEAERAAITSLVFIATFFVALGIGQFLKRREGVRLGLLFRLFCLILAFYAAIAVYGVHASWRYHVGTAAILLSTALVVALVNRYVWDFYFEKKRQTPVPRFLREVVGGIIFLIVPLVVLSVGYHTEAPLKGVLAGLGVVAIILGFAAQNFFAGIISGLAIQINRPYKVGDWLQLGERFAEVMEINWRSTRLRTNDGIYLDIPNNQMMSHPIVILRAAPTKLGPASPKSGKRPLKSKRKADTLEKRAGVLAELSELDREQQSLEGRLAQYGGAVSRSDLSKAETRPKEIHEKRIELLSPVNPRPSNAVSVFVSYSHADEGLRNELGKHLSVLERQGIITTWHDRMIGAGTEWEGSIDRHLDHSRVILLLISSDFIHSRYCYDVEMTRALERHDNRQALVIPIILRAVSLKGTPFAKLQALPKDGKPIATWQDRDLAFVDVTDGLRNAIQDLVGTA